MCAKRVYISADFDLKNGDRDVVDVLRSWGRDARHITDFIDTSMVASGSVADEPDCRPCDLKAEFNRQINAASAIIFIVGDKTALRTAGCECERFLLAWDSCSCTPYKKNHEGRKQCKCPCVSQASEDVGNINPYSYLQHECEQARRKEKKIIVVYNSLIKQPGWLPKYMKDCASIAEPFWIKDRSGCRIGNYQFIKEALGYE